MQKLRLILACLLWVGAHSVGKGQNIADNVAQLNSFITAVNTGALINPTIHLKPQVYTLTNVLAITNSCVIQGGGATIKTSSNPPSTMISITNSATVSISHVHFEGWGNTTINQAINLSDANLSLSGCEFNKFYAPTSGVIFGGSSTGAHTLNITHCYIHDNGGNGVYSGSSSSFNFTIKNTTFDTNTGIAVNIATPSGNSNTHNIINTTFFQSGKHLDFNVIGKVLYLEQCTLYGSDTIPLTLVGGSITLKNTVITAYLGTTPAFTLSGTNVIQSAANSPNLNMNTSLENRGGFAPVLALNVGSSLINAASNAPELLDQRGALFNGTRDIGAYEYNGTFENGSPALTVYNTNPFGYQSLYQAIVNANNQPTGATAPTIKFNIDNTDIGYQVTTNHYRITPLAINIGAWSSYIKDNFHLPPLTRTGITIDGEANPNTNLITNANNAQLKIEINGANVGTTSNGINIQAPNCTLLDLNINSFQGIGINILPTSTGTVVQGCFIGTDITGSMDLGNATDGIFINGLSNILIGGNLPAQQNIISGNGNYGIGVGNTIRVNIQGNTIGLNTSKNASIPNGAAGIGFLNSNASSDIDRSFIGGTSVGAMNIISGNSSNGIFITSCSRMNIYNNYIGIKGDGSVQGNGSQGIHIWGNSSNINIGNGLSTGRNVIGGNSTDNIILFENSGVAPHDISISGNHIGVGINGTTSLGGGRGIELSGALTKNIYISKNIIACNIVKGISLTSSANEGVAPPVIMTANPNKIEGTADANASATVDVYLDNSTCVLSSPKQGHTYLGTTNVDIDVPNNIGKWILSSADINPAYLPLPLGAHIVAIQHSGTNNNNTSEFSASMQVTNALPTSANITFSDVLEDIPYPIQVPFTDAEDATITKLKIETLPTNGNLRYDDGTGGQPIIVTAGTKYEINANKYVYYTSGGNESGINYDTFNFRVVDAAQDSSAASHTATMNVLPVNDTPTLADLPAQLPISKNSPAVIVNLTGIGTGAPNEEVNQTLTVTVNAVPNNILSFTNITQSGSTGSFNYSVSGTVTAPTPVTITVKVQDSGGTDNDAIDFIEKTVTVQVIPNLDDPYDLLATLESTSSVRLTWRNDAQNVAGFQVYRAVGSPTANYALLATLNSTVNLTYLDATVALGEFYFYKVRSILGNNFSEYSNTSGVRVVNVSATPTGLQASLVAGKFDQVALTWTDTSQDEAGFKLEHYSVFSQRFVQIADLPANTTSYTNVALLANVTYQYRIRSYTADRQNSPYSNVATIRTPKDVSVAPPNAPFNLEATAVSEKQNNLRWEYNTNPQVVYTVERSITSSTNFQEIGEYISPELVPVKNYIDSTGIQAGAIHYYRIKASTAGGTSAYSNIDTVRARCNLRDLAIVRNDNGKEVICANKSAAMGVVSKVFGATYQWKRNGVNVEGAKFETFYASQTGVYTCVITAGSCVSPSVNSLFVAILNAPDVLQVQQQNNELIASINNADAYQWFYDYQPINGATERTHKPTKAGAYYVVATVESCTSTSPNYLYGTLSAESTDISQYIQLAPNPTELHTSLSLDLPAVGKYEVVLRDSKGKTITTYAGKKTDYSFSLPLDLKGLSAGLYMVEVRIAGRQGYKKLIIR